MNKNVILAASIAGAAATAYFITRWFKNKEYPLDEVIEDLGDSEAITDGDEGVISFAGNDGFGIEIEPETDYISVEGEEEDSTEDEEVHAWHEDGAVYGDEQIKSELIEFELIGEKEFETTEPDYSKNKLTFYVKDETLVEDESMRIVSIEYTIGHEAMNLLISNPYSSSLYLRYPLLGADYEVKMDPGSFTDALKELDVGGTD